MCTRNQALDIFSQAYKMCGDLFADKLTDAYLYGSYARGDYDDESDCRAQMQGVCNKQRIKP